MSAMMKQRLKGERASAAHRLAPGVAILGAALSLATLPACGGSNQPTGSLYVTVLDKSMSPVADAEVTTDPATQSLVTDALGTVFFPKVPAVGYAVTASHPTAGSGRATAQVVANEVADAVITVTRPPVGGGDGGQAGGPGAGGGGGVGTGGLPGSGGVAGAGAASTFASSTAPGLTPKSEDATAKLGDAPPPTAPLRLGIRKTRHTTARSLVRRHRLRS
jgi:hypothetical protein